MRHSAEVETFVAAAREATGQPIELFDVFAFGDSPGMADELAALVASGRKRATASLLGADEPLPLVGEFSVVLDGEGLPVALIRNREVTVGPFRDVDEAFARDEGEGDLSLGYWREAHRDFFTRTKPGFTEDSPVVCERFELVYPRPQP
jgi:uncharacterized protein YhfF